MSEKDEKKNTKNLGPGTVRSSVSKTVHKSKVDPDKLPKVVAFTGFQGVGKDLAATKLIKDYGYELVKFADGLKVMLKSYLEYQGVDPKIIIEMIEGELKETPSEFLEGRTPRLAMQTLGTEWGRALIGSNVWVNATLNRIKSLDKVVITDMRFKNEANAVHDISGAASVRIVRPGREQKGLHPSEVEIANLKINAEVLNDDTPEVLHDRLIEQLKVIK